MHILTISTAQDWQEFKEKESVLLQVPWPRVQVACPPTHPSWTKQWSRKRLRHLATEGTKEQIPGCVGARQPRPVSRETWSNIHQQRVHSSPVSMWVCNCIEMNAKKPGSTQPLVCWTRSEKVECRSSASKKYSRKTSNMTYFFSIGDQSTLPCWK